MPETTEKKASSSSNEPGPAIEYDMPPEPGADIPPETPPDGPEGLPEGQEGHSGAVVSPDAFFAGVRGFFGSPNVILIRKGVEPLKSLVIEPDDQAARQASDCLYEICLETPWLNFLVNPESKWAARVFIIGGFSFSRFQMVQAEIHERRQVARSAAVISPASPSPGSAETPPPPGPPHEDMAELKAQAG